jgi:hypothetical protein
MAYERQPIPFRPDPTALREAAMRSVVRAALLACANSVKVPNAGALAAFGAVTVTTAPPVEPVKNPHPQDRAVEWMQRGAVSPTRTTDAAGLLQTAYEFIAGLTQVSAAASVIAQSLRLDFNNAGAISIPAVSLPLAKWVAEGGAIPVQMGSASVTTMSPFKVAEIIPLTNEMLHSGNSEALMRQTLIENIGPAFDALMFSNAAGVANQQPPGLLFGVTPLTATAAGSAAMFTDLSNLIAALAPVAGTSPPVIIAAPRQATTILLTAIDPPTVLASAAVAAGTVIALCPGALATAVGVPEMSASDGEVHMDSVPGEIVSSPGVVAAGVKSGFQTDCTFLRYVQKLTWAKRNAAAVQIVQSVNW